MTTMDSHFPQFPKTRPELPSDYQKIYQTEYLINRTAGGFANRIAAWLESWMHKRIAQSGPKPLPKLLEIGAGTLNHVAHEATFSQYDAIEPLRFLWTSTGVTPPGQVYADLNEVPRDRRYDRIFSVAVLEHLCELPEVIAHSGLLLEKDGLFAAGIPSEGGLLWKLAWQYGTGPGFKKRTGLDYGPLMRFEHVNDAQEIEGVLRYFFSKVDRVRFPLPFLNLSFYTLLIGSQPKITLCHQFLNQLSDSKSLSE